MTYDSAITEALRLSHKYAQPIYILGLRNWADEYDFRAVFAWEREAFYMSEDAFAIAYDDGTLDRFYR